MISIVRTFQTVDLKIIHFVTFYKPFLPRINANLTKRMKGNKLMERSSLTATVNNLPSIGELDPSIFVGNILLNIMLLYLIIIFQ